MDSTWYEHFKEDLQAEINDIFEEACEKKEHIWDLVANYLRDERGFQSFLDQYEAFFEREHRQIKHLQQEVVMLQQRLTARENNEGLFNFDENIFDQPDVDDYDSSDTDEDEHFYDEDNSDIDEDVTFVDIGVAPEITESDNNQLKNNRERKRKPVNIKKQIAHQFLWVYHPRDTGQVGDKFFTQRSGLITRLVDDPYYDAVDVMLRLPFTQRDKSLWRQIYRRSSENNNLETQWFQYRLWHRLLDIALPRAESLAATVPHKLYPLYQKMKTQQRPVLDYFQELKEEKQQTIAEIEQRILALRQKLKNREV